MWAIMYVVYAGMPANVPQVTSTSFSELLKIPLPSEIEMVTGSSSTQKLVGERVHTNNQLTSNSSECASYPDRTMAPLQSHLENGMLL